MAEPGRTEPVPDPAGLAAVLGTSLHGAGLPVGPDRCERLARALTVAGARTLPELHACALATLVSDPAHLPVFDQVFAALFGTPIPQASPAAPSPAAPWADADQADRIPASPPPPAAPGGLGAHLTATGQQPPPDGDDPPAGTPVVRRVASATERLRGRDFAELSAAELARLAGLMRELTLAIPPRRTRRYRAARHGTRPDLRATMRAARRSGGEPIRLACRAPGARARRLVVLCDISGSMEPYARALLLLLYCLYGAANARAGPARPEVFSFATRLSRLTPALAAPSPGTMLARAGEAAPDWSGGTRIGAAVKEFNDRYGCPGLARGAVVLIISDGWETGEPGLLGAQMARLSRVAHRIVWANPRTASPRFRPEAAGMAAAWPYCDAVVSAHSLDALPGLLAALAR